MEGLKKNLHRPKPIKDGRWVHHKRGQGSTSIDMTLGIVGIPEMQKCRVCNVKFSISSVGLHILTLLVKYVGIRNIPATVFPPVPKKYLLLS